METGVGSHQEGRGQRDADAHSHETTLPFVGRVAGHVRLYRERGRGGEGGNERRAPRKIRRGRGPTKAVGHSELSRNAEAICPAKSLSHFSHVLGIEPRTSALNRKRPSPVTRTRDV